MHFTSKKQVHLAMATLRKARTGKNTHYPVAFKKALCEFIAGNPKITAHKFGKELDMNNSTMFYWLQQFKSGLYEADAVYSVSVKSQALVKDLRAQLTEKIADLQAKVDLIDKAKALGLDVIETTKQKKSA